MRTKTNNDNKNQTALAGQASEQQNHLNNREAWELYFKMGQLIEGTDNAGLLADIEFWAREIARQAKQKAKRRTY